MAEKNNEQLLQRATKKGCVRVILVKDLRGLGDRDDMVEVRAGYARNYLIPNGIAMAVTPSVLRQFEETAAA